MQLISFTIIVLQWKQFSGFDDAIYNYVSGFLSDDMTRFMKFMTFMGSEWPITTLAIAIPFLIFILKKKKYYAAGLMATLNIATGSPLYEVLKQIFRRPRPSIHRLIEIGGYSFPSGHSMNSMIFYGFLVYLILEYMKSRLKYPLAAVICLMIPLIGISRIYLGVHYASDVLAGFIFGFIWLIFFINFAERFILKHKKDTNKVQ